MLLHVTCLFVPGAPPPEASLSRSRCSPEKGAVLSPEVYSESTPVKPHLGPKLSNRQAGESSSEPFQHVSLDFVEAEGVRTHLCATSQGEAKIDAKHPSVFQKVSVQDLAAGAFSAIIHPSSCTQSRVTCRRKQSLAWGAKVPSSVSHISKS